MRTWLEAGLAVGSGRYSVIASIEEYDFGRYDTKALKCIDKVDESEPPLIELSMEPLVSTIHWYVFGMMMSLGILVFEIVFKLVRVRFLVNFNDILSNVQYSLRSIVHAARVMLIYPIQRNFYRGMSYLR